MTNQESGIKNNEIVNRTRKYNYINMIFTIWFPENKLCKVHHNFPYTIRWSIAKVSNWSVLLGEHKVWNQSFTLKCLRHPYVNSPKLYAISMNQPILTLAISFCCVDSMSINQTILCNLDSSTRLLMWPLTSCREEETSTY